MRLSCPFLKRRDFFITMKNSSQKKGLTLVELLIALFVLTVGILSLVLFFSNAINAIEYASDITAATSHAEYILEEMQRRDSLANITATDWTSWAQSEGFVNLPSETINVTFTNATADPLETQARIGWVRDSRQSNVSLMTRITVW